MLRFSLSDTGVGIPGPMLEAVFERFWQVSQSDVRGQGLGLYISKSIVEAHRGRIWGESQPGQGTQVSAGPGTGSAASDAGQTSVTRHRQPSRFQ